MIKIKNKSIKYLNNVMIKAKNNDSIRVLYKKVGQVPEIRIIDNIFKLKKAIIDYKLEIIPYKNFCIICNNKKLFQHMNPNIALPLKGIYGSLILVKINKKKREFESLKSDDILWYIEDLNNKNYNNTPINKVNESISNKTINLIGNNKKESNIYEKTLLKLLIHIDLVLTSILKNEKIENK